MGTVHHAWVTGSDVTDRVQQQPATRADSRVRLDHDGDDPRSAHRARRRSWVCSVEPARVDGGTIKYRQEAVARVARLQPSGTVPAPRQGRKIRR